MDIQDNAAAFEQQWFSLAETICEHIYGQPNIQEMAARFREGKRLTSEERSEFISTANRIKYEVIHERFGDKGTEEFEQFRQAWKHWFNTKKGTSEQLNGRRLTNAEHIVYSSTPDPEEFLANFSK